MFISLYIPGKPIPQGSLSVGRNGQMFWTNNATLRPYRLAIATALRHEMSQHVGFEVSKDQGFAIDITFRKARPKSHLLSSGAVNPKAPRRLTQVPDYCDKGARAVLDAITDSKVVYADDAQVTDLMSRKRYANDEFPEGTYLTITDVEVHDDWR